MARRRLQIIRLLSFSFLVTTLLFSISCEPGGGIIFLNQRSEEVKVFVTHVRADGSISGFTDRGTILAKTTKTVFITFLGDEWVNRIEIRDSTEKVLLSNDYRMADLEKVGWKITIPP